MATEISIIEKAMEIISYAPYEPEHIGYFVKKNDIDLGGEDYCRKCIPSAVKDAKKHYNSKRAEIISKYKEIEETGYYKGINVVEKHGLQTIENSKILELEEYPDKAKFSYEGHDPDFSGGCTEPITCEGCGNYFYINFCADEECAIHLDFDNIKKLKSQDKWAIWMALSNYEYAESEAKTHLLKIAEKVINQTTNL